MTTDVDDDLERVLAARLHALARHARTESGVLWRSVEPPRHSRRWSGAVVAASVVVCLAMIALVVVATRESEVRVSTGPAVSGPAGAKVAEALANAPVEGRSGHAAVWTGSEFVVWGGVKPRSGSGEVALADGAAYNPTTGTWRILAKAPIAARGLPAYVWTGSELVVWGGYDNGQPVNGGAAYDPTDAPIASRQAPAAVWSGTEVIVVGGFDRGHLTNDAIAYNPVENRWRTLASPPGFPLAPRPQAVWSNGRVVMLLSASGGPGQQSFVAGYDPQSDRWATYAAAPIPANLTPQIGALGSEVFVLTNSADRPGAALDLRTNTWRTLAAGPGLAVYSWTFIGRRAVFWSGGPVGAIYDVDSDMWRVFEAGDLARRDDSTVVAANQIGFSWGGFISGGPSWTGASDGVTLRPSLETAPLSPDDDIPRATSPAGASTSVPARAGSDATVPSRCATTSPAGGC